ncbi:MAG TPA: hypothetical protein VGB77_06255 [Abditibacteriaceae bacterium]
MAYSVKSLKPADLEAIAEAGGEIHAQIRAKEVIIRTGPGFGTSFKLILLGAALGAGVALFWKSRQESAPFSLSASETEKASADLSARLQQLSQRAKSLGARAKDAMHSAAEIAAPAVQHALDEAKQAARHAESEINDELRELNEKDNKPEQV